MPPKPKRKAPPYPFVLEALAPLAPEVRRMFSGFAVYIGDRIVLMLRDHTQSPQDNGMWLVLSESVNPDDPSLRQEFPSLRPIELLHGKISHWLLIPATVPLLRRTPCTPATGCCIATRDSAVFRNPGVSQCPPERSIQFVARTSRNINSDASRRICV